MPAPAVSSGGSDRLTVHDVLVQWGPAYRARFEATLPPRQREVLATILTCRTPARGGEVYRCPDCGRCHYSYHSCNDRHCPRCGTADADAWLAANQALLLPVPYFFVTFTVPEALRSWLRSHPAVGYDALFAASARALQDLAQNPKRLGATLGMLGVLHTWSRTLIHHPHVHFLVPGGGLSLDQRTWVPARNKFLVRVEPLSDHYRTLFRQHLERHHPAALKEIPASVWQQRWVTYSKAVGTGENALRYLSRYLFKTATGNRRLEHLPNGKLRWPYRDSTTGAWRRIDLEPDELIRRFLQHVLPAGFHRVRRFGWLHPGGRKKLNRVRALLGQSPVLTDAQRAAWFPPAPDDPDALEPPEPDAQPSTRNAQPIKCPHCGGTLVRVGRWRPGQPPPRPPPGRAPPRP